ncbi:hypothetical protein F3Y22_tig00110198pilonHSYRG00127 [Hibiscus syriacus]|uniref:Uncharacterized protein n=1 Tax=Hibiscus syriacus TaxID=106335 RepID=A0A6A3BB77_HIBSY|nr:hypothetical protein F3Y22_tig00110198pilonHSYRG00127 [Hibiscus syriacus]
MRRSLKKIRFLALGWSRRERKGGRDGRMATNLKREGSRKPQGGKILTWKRKANTSSSNKSQGEKKQHLEKISIQNLEIQNHGLSDDVNPTSEVGRTKEGGLEDIHPTMFDTMDTQEACRSSGATSTNFRRHLNEISRIHKPEIIALFETRTSDRLADKAIKRFEFPNTFRVEAHGFSGEIGIKVGILHRSICKPEYYNPKTIMEPAAAYGTSIERSIDTRRRFQCHPTARRTPWLFHAWSGISKSFNNFVYDSGIIKVEYKGPDFTWKRGSLYKRLDRCFINNSGADEFPMTSVIHQNRVGSDHCPLLLQLQKAREPPMERPFRFLAARQEHPKFNDFLSNVWLKDGETVANLKIFQEKALQRNYSDRLLELDRQLKRELDEVLRYGESLWFQESRSKWIVQGDKNTKIFHASTMQRRRTNTITSLKTQDGIWCTDQQKLKDMAVDFYKQLYTSSGCNGTNYSTRDQFPRESMETMQSLCRPIEDEEIKGVIFEMNPLKAPGDNTTVISSKLGFTEVNDLGKYLRVPLLHTHVTKASSIRLDRTLPITSWSNNASQSSLFDNSILHNAINAAAKRNIMDTQNAAFLSKLGFNLITQRDKLWVKVLRTKYKCSKDIPESLDRRSCSRLWKGISLIWNDVKDGLTWNIGDGKTTGGVEMERDIRSTTPMGEVAHEKILTNSERVRRHLTTRENCEVCGASVESTYHLFREYPTALAIWSNLVKTDKLIEFLELGSKDWIRLNLEQPKRFTKVPEGWDILFGSILWSLWLSRNARIFNPESTHMESVLEHSSRRLQNESYAANKTIKNGISGRKNVNGEQIRWTPPPQGWVKSNIDGARSLNEGKASCRGVIQGNSSEWVVGFAKNIGMCTIVEAKLWGVLIGLQQAWRLGD